MATTISGTAGVTFPAGGVGNPASAVVGLTDTQTLTNKTLTSPNIGGTPAMNASVITSGTAQASTSGTNIDFTGLPSWVKRVTVMFNGVSTNGTSVIQVQIGSGSVTTSGYVSQTSTIANISTIATSGFTQNYSPLAANINGGLFVITLVSGFSYLGSGTLNTIASTDNAYINAGTITLGGVLDRIRITTVSGTGTFDAGSINILYE